MKEQKDAKSYLDRLNAPILTPKQRLENLSVLLDLNRDIVNDCVADGVARPMTATIIELDERARARGILDPITMALESPSSLLYRGRF